jgi:uncharacterized protein YbjT (DUF2867 family)
MTTHQQRLVPVLGGTGKVGRRSVGRLITRGVRVRIGARGTGYAAKTAARGVWSTR